MVTFLKEKLALLWGGFQKSSKCISWVLATLILSFSYFIYQEVSFSTERLGHLIEKASMMRNLQEADHLLKEQQKGLILMNGLIGDQRKFIIEQDQAIRMLIDKINELNNKNRIKGLEI
jgi:hypothetical protein